MSSTRYGVISDTHQHTSFLPLALDRLKIAGVEKLLVNGDIGTGEQHIAFTLDCIGKTGLESYVQPGSHERLNEYEPLIAHYAKKYSNIIDVFSQRKVEARGHHLVFMPGSDFCCGGQYCLDRVDDVPSGFYKNKQGPLRLININDLQFLVSDPEKTIVVCHVPRKFNSLDYGVDMAEFGEAVLDFYLEGNIVPRGSVFPIDTARHLAATTLFPVMLKKENRGNKDLLELYEKIGIQKAVSGHFHESVHRACDSKGKLVEEGKLTQELFWMASYLDGMKAGILTVDDTKVSYNNISFSF